MVTYCPRYGRCVQSPRGSDASKPARRVVQERWADVERARGAAADDALRCDEASEVARGGRSRGEQAAWAREIALPESGSDRLVHDRWVSKYAEPWAAELSELKRKLEKTMEKVFEIYIKTTPERLWHAITDTEMRRKYNFG